MDTALIPTPDTIPVAWGWFQFLLLLTFPLHLLAMNAMLGAVLFGSYLHWRGGAVQIRLAHRLAQALPLIIAFVVNLGVAPFLFVQVLYGQFIYTSSVLIGIAWLAVIPILLAAYSGAYLYDFRFRSLGRVGILIGAAVTIALLLIAWIFTTNMQLMILPEKFATYFLHRDGSYLLSDYPALIPRYLHTIFGALAIGGLSLALLGRFQAERDREMADLALSFGLRVFLGCTLINLAIGCWYLLTLPRPLMLTFMGQNSGATIAFIAGLLLTIGALIGAARQRLWLTVGHAVMLVVLMTWMRAWLRAGSLADAFTLDQLKVIPQYSPMLFFFITLLGGLLAIFWLLRKAATAFKGDVLK